MKINQLQICGKCGYLKMILSNFARNYTVYCIYAYHVCMYYIITLYNIMLPHLPQFKKYAFKSNSGGFFVGT